MTSHPFVEHPQDKLVPVITSITDAINTQSLTGLYFFLFWS